MNKIVDKVKQTIDRLTNKRPWDKYYKEVGAKNHIDVPNLSIYELYDIFPLSSLKI